jgi:hypothetical protein
VIENVVEYEWEYFQTQRRLYGQSTRLTEEWLKGLIDQPDPFGFVKQSEQINVQSLQRSLSSLTLNTFPKSSSTSNLSKGLIRSASVPLLNKNDNSDDETTTPPRTPGDATPQQRPDQAQKGTMTDIFYRGKNDYTEFM